MQHDSTPDSSPDAALPVIGLEGLSGGGPGALERVARAIASACERSGFFYVAGHGIDEAVVEALRQQARRFFAQPEPVKAAIAINRVNRGYLGPGQARMQGAAHTDLKEVFFWGRELAADDPDVLAGRPLCGPNRWPAAPPGFRAAVERYHRAAAGLGDSLLRAFAVALGQAPAFFAPFYERPMTRGQLIHYPPPPPGTSPERFGVAPHSDFGCITLLLQETAGLEVLARDGGWIAAPPLPGSLVVNIGDLMERWTGGRLPSTRHRVRNMTGADRYSIAIFHDPSPSALVDPADLSGAADAAFPPIEAAAYIDRRNRGAFAHYGPEAAAPKAPGERS